MKVRTRKSDRKSLDQSLKNFYQSKKELRQSCQIKKNIEFQHRVCDYLEENKKLQEEINKLKKDLS